ncbi:hypothetical protein [Eggerthella sinensis]|uniref:hypothetical protein n=1 Tax=Eggerthella sinensis TaxID=242230 RepID=UPI0022E614D4|nr:hypothetical protein [Eggerthella sinensis]
MYIQTYSLWDWLFTGVGLAYSLSVSAMAALLFWVLVSLRSKKGTLWAPIPVGVGSASVLSAAFLLYWISTMPGGFLAQSALTWLVFAPYFFSSLAVALSSFALLLSKRRFRFENPERKALRALASALIFEIAYIIAIPLLVFVVSFPLSLTL